MPPTPSPPPSPQGISSFRKQTGKLPTYVQLGLTNCSNVPGSDLIFF